VGLLAGEGIHRLGIFIDGLGRLVVLGICLLLITPAIKYRKSLDEMFSRRWGFIYMAITWHPTARWNRKVCGYVGKSTQKMGERWDQHEFGYWWSGEWKPPQVWADTLIEWRVICEPKRRLGITLAFLEWLNIKVRFPLYNDKMNRTTNPRRIDKVTAVQQRTDREEWRLAA